jgi:anti-sigma factor RsiW
MKEETEMREHEEIGGLLATYRDLGDADQQRVDRHVQSCAACAARLASYREQDRNLAQLTDAHPGGRLRRDFYAAVETRGEAAPLARVRSLAGQAAELAVVILLIAALGFILRERLQSMALPAAPAPEAAPSTISHPSSAPAPSAALPEAAPAAPAKVSPATEGQPSPVMLQANTSVVTTTAAAQASEGESYVVRLDDSL